MNLLSSPLDAATLKQTEEALSFGLTVHLAIRQTSSWVEIPTHIFGEMVDTDVIFVPCMILFLVLLCKCVCRPGSGTSGNNASNVRDASDGRGAGAADSGGCGGGSGGGGC